MLTKILIALAVIVIVFVVIVALRPSEYRVARTVTISAPAPVVFAQVNDFHKWNAWNTWAKMDAAMKQTYEGAPTGTGNRPRVPETLRRHQHRGVHVQA
jgi:predicted membrane-bound mannosyltransferase